MPRINAEQEREREEIVFRAVQNNPGLKQSELTVHTQLQSRTLYNYLNELEYRGRLRRDKQRWYVSEAYTERKLRPFELTAEQAMSLYIAARALARVQDERNETAESALSKLASALVGDFNIGKDMQRAVENLAQRPERTGYNKIYRELTRGCVYRKKVKLEYETAKGFTFETEFEPYLLEPSLFGFSIYAIGYSSNAQAFRSFKLERIRSIELLRADFEPRENAPTLASLNSAWSIMYGDETETVELEFAPSVRRRVLETNWHPSQKVDNPDPNLSAPLNWRIEVADATDMLPWVRGWGADVSVIQPEWMRNEIGEHVRVMSNSYGLAQSRAMSDVPAHQWLWAKADGKGNLHRLVYHMIDVGLCAMALWQRALNAKLKLRIAGWLGLNIEDTGKLIGFWASLHDLGKASPAFQDHPRMNRVLKIVVMNELKLAGLEFKPYGNFVRHEVISTWALRSGRGEGLLAELCQLPKPFAEQISQMLGGHHGAFPTSIKFDPTILTREHCGEGVWPKARRELAREMQRIFDPPHFQPPAPNLERDNIMLMLIAGIVSAADWLGSDEDNFPYERSILPLSSYMQHSRSHAEAALLRVNWDQAAHMPPFEFAKVFPFDPSESQQEVMTALGKAQLPALGVIEAPMGAGKTETALAVYADWAKRHSDAGLYVAMPTTATSNQMHERVRSFLARQMNTSIEPLLIHSQAQLRKTSDERSAEIDTVEDEEGEAAGGQSWFLPRKKSLLLPYGVGTVDQTLMGVLQTKHFFVRLLGLSHKVIIFDEVHAYDTYMSELFKRLLVWLRAVEASVIVLSATLPKKMRLELIQAYTGKEPRVPAQPYPRLTVAEAQGYATAIPLTFPSSESKTLRFDWVQPDADAVVAKLRETLIHDGCAAVICNTVTRAQEVYQAIEQSDVLREEDKANSLFLFHARFPMAWRETLEQKVLKKFGAHLSDKKQKNPDRPKRAIVVATQVIEQSLDLDFDVMISDHAPVDLLLQRAGRLHRHKINEPRPQPYCLFIAAPAPTDADGLPRFSQADQYVYDPYSLLRSWLVLQGREPKAIALPSDLSELIEQVYGDEEAHIDPNTQKALIASKRKLTNDQIEKIKKARRRRIVKPDDEDFLTAENTQFEEGNPALNEVYQAFTRSDRPGLNVICLHRVNGRLCFEPEMDSQSFELNGKYPRSLVVELARRSLTLRRPQVEIAIAKEYDDPQAVKLMRRWNKIAALKYHHVVIFDNGLCKVGKSTTYRLELIKQDKLGLSIFKESA
jgi:CRISPR-associated endonuclease/helicase Cas3